MIYERNGIKHMDSTVHGLRIRRSLRTRNLREAIETERRVVSAGIIDPFAEMSTMGFRDAATRHLDIRKPSLSEKTVKTEIERHKALFRFFGNQPVSKLRAGHWMSYRKFRFSSGVAQSTVAREFDVFQSLMRCCGLWGYFEPYKRTLDPPLVFRERRRLEAAEVELLLVTAASKPYWQDAHLAIAFAVFTAMRRNEILSLRWQDIDFCSEILRVGKGKTPSAIRTIPLHRELISLIQRRRELIKPMPEHFVFPAGTGFGSRNPTGHLKSINGAWPKITKACGLKGLQFHDLRATVISHFCAMPDVSEQAVREMVGHVSQRMISLYSRVRMEAKRRATEQLQYARPKV